MSPSNAMFWNHTQTSTKWLSGWLIALLLLLPQLAPIADAGRSLRRARYYFKKANRFARRGKSVRAIYYYKAAIRFLQGQGTRYVRGRWEATYRIAILRHRKRAYKRARQLFLQLRRNSPSPVARYQRRIDKWMARLAAHLPAEVELLIRPPQATVTLQTTDGRTILPTQTNPQPGQTRYLFAVKHSSTQLTIAFGGYQPITKRLYHKAPYITRYQLTLLPLQGQTLAKKRYAQARQHLQQQQYQSAYQLLRQAKRALQSARDINSTSNKQLRWDIELSLGEWMIRTRRFQQGSQHYHSLRQQAYTNERDAQLKAHICKLAREHAWTPPKEFSCQSLQSTKTITTATTPKPTPPRTSSSGTPGAVTLLLFGAGIISGGAAAGIYFGFAEPALQQRNRAATLQEEAQSEQHYVNGLIGTWVAIGVAGAAILAGTITYFAVDRKATSAPPSPTGNKDNTQQRLIRVFD